MDPDAIVLAGGDNRRMGGADKVMLEIGGRPILIRILDGLAGLGISAPIVVGAPRRLDRPVRWCREDPPGGGPVAALAAAGALLRAPATVVLAGDLPFVAEAVPDLLAALGDEGDRNHPDVAVLVDGGGRRNLLAAAWRTTALIAALGRGRARRPGGARSAGRPERRRGRRPCRPRRRLRHLGRAGECSGPRRAAT